MPDMWEFPEAKALAKAINLEVWQTGGGCEAFGVNTTDDKGNVLVSVETFVDHDPHDAQWIVGLYDEDGGFVCAEEKVTLPRALEIADEWRRFKVTDLPGLSFETYIGATAYLRAAFEISPDSTLFVYQPNTDHIENKGEHIARRALDAACKSIQDDMGVEYGDAAGAFFSDSEIEQAILLILRRCAYNEALWADIPLAALRK